MANRMRQLNHEDYTVTIICPLEVEVTAMRSMLDEAHARLPGRGNEPNRYILGRIGPHNVAIGYLPYGSQGIAAAAAVATDMRRTFPRAQLRLLVGIAGGIPSPQNDIRLGDVVVGVPEGVHGGVVQHDRGRSTVYGFERQDFFCPLPDVWQRAVAEMRSDHQRGPSRVDDFLMQMLATYPALQQYARPAPPANMPFPPQSQHGRGDMPWYKRNKSKAIIPQARPGPKIFYGTIASGDCVMKDAERRDAIGRALGGALCFEMEAAGLGNGFPCVVVRGISDYADSHKNDDWQPYAAAVAAACAKALLTYVNPI